MRSNPTRDFYLSIENADPAAGDDWPDAPLPQRDDPFSHPLVRAWFIACGLIIGASLAYLAAQVGF